METYHEGERRIQELAGATLQADQLSGMVQDGLSMPAGHFLLEQRFAALSTVGDDGSVWVSGLIGEPGFLHPISAEAIVIDAHKLSRQDILWTNLNAGKSKTAGMVAINFALRRRLRINGKARADDEFIVFEIEQTYSNCPKYIQRRELEHTPEAVEIAKLETTRDTTLNEDDRAFIARSDTFFIGSYAKDGGADASHRGGKPGFVRMIDETHIRFPDYSGNNMFNTLGNLSINPNLGMLFIDFNSGNTLQISGQAESIEPFHWHNGEKQGHVDVAVKHVIRTSGGALGQWDFQEFSPFNPKD
ncbi:MAG: pyridoxamine 5'-phosphate oxidase family protein [Cyanobacteria bacterium SZAS LIN-3]|nr:pyridoxamine 5'-phosphate oxidase family protein [Cyanobacteria bacterium SZAS LIN-3]